MNKGNLTKHLKKNERLLIDGCHSETSAKNLNDYLKTLKQPIYGIWGMQKNKEPEKFIKKFKNTFKKIITVTIPNEPNALNASELKKISLQNKNKSATAKNVIEAIKKCSSNEKKVIVCRKCSSKELNIFLYPRNNIRFCCCAYFCSF